MVVASFLELQLRNKIKKEVSNRSMASSTCAQTSLCFTTHRGLQPHPSIRSPGRSKLPARALDAFVLSPHTNASKLHLSSTEMTEVGNKSNADHWNAKNYQIGSFSKKFPFFQIWSITLRERKWVEGRESLYLKKKTKKTLALCNHLHVHCAIISKKLKTWILFSLQNVNFSRLRPHVIEAV